MELKSPSKRAEIIRDFSAREPALFFRLIDHYKWPAEKAHKRSQEWMNRRIVKEMEKVRKE